jgi:hypothetical protein
LPTKCIRASRNQKGRGFNRLSNPTATKKVLSKNPKEVIATETYKLIAITESYIVHRQPRRQN